MQCQSVVSATKRLHHDLHISIELPEEERKTFNGKLPKLTAQQLGPWPLGDD